MVILIALLCLPPFYLAKQKKEKVDSSILLEAIDSTARLPKKHSGALLISLLKYPSPYKSNDTNTEFLIRTIKALGVIAEKKAIDKLIPFLSYPNSKVQKATLQSIGKILQRESKNSHKPVD